MIFGNVLAMDDQPRAGLDAWERLRWARLRAGHASGEEAARAIGIKPGTYRAYERSPDSSKAIALDYANAVMIARKLGVRWEWLLDGRGPAIEPRGADTAMARVLRVMGDQDAATQDAIATAVESLVSLPKRAGS